MTDALDTTEVTPRTRPYHAVQVTERTMLLDLGYVAGGASSGLREETWQLIHRQQMMNTRSR